MSEDNVIIELKKPIEAHGETVKTLTLRPLNAGLLRKIKGNPQKDSFEMTAQYIELCGDIPESSVNAMHPTDLMKCSDVLTGFLIDSQPTGKS